MILNTLIKPTKKNIVIGILSIVSLFSVLYINSYKNNSSINSTTQTPQTTTRVNPSVSGIQSLNQSEIIIPQTIPLPNTNLQVKIYKASSSPNLNQIATEISRYFKLSLDTENPGSWYNNDYTQSLKANTQFGFIQFKIDGFNNPKYYSGPNKPTSNIALETATSFINSLPGLSDLKPEISKLRYVRNTGETHLENGTEKNYDAIEISFFPYKDGLPVYFSNDISPIATVLIGQNYQITDVYIKSQTIIIKEPLKTIITKDINQILEEIKSKKAYVFDAGLISQQQLSESKYPPITITELNLEYRYIPESDLIIPYVGIKGVYQFTNSQSSPIYLLLPLEKD